MEGPPSASSPNRAGSKMADIQHCREMEGDKLRDEEEKQMHREREKKMREIMRDAKKNKWTKKCICEQREIEIWGVEVDNI